MQLNKYSILHHHSVSFWMESDWLLTELKKMSEFIQINLYFLPWSNFCICRSFLRIRALSATSSALCCLTCLPKFRFVSLLSLVSMIWDSFLKSIYLSCLRCCFDFFSSSLRFWLFISSVYTLLGTFHDLTKLSPSTQYSSTNSSLLLTEDSLSYGVG